MNRVKRRTTYQYGRLRLEERSRRANVWVYRYFYSDPSAPYATRKDRKAWERVQDELQRLQAVRPASAAEAP